MYVLLTDAMGHYTCAAHELTGPISMCISILADVLMAENIYKCVSGEY